jgi:glycosyltransferase involved in cell wall biosynthesis
LTVVDIALRFGAGYDGLGTYLRAKQRYAARSTSLVHHAVVPAGRGRHSERWTLLDGSPSSPEPNQRVAPSPSGLVELLDVLCPDVVVVHGELHAARRAITAARWTGALIVAVPHRVPVGSGARALWAPQRWWVNRHEQRALRHVDVVVQPAAAGAPDSVAVRLGVDPEFRPEPGLRRGDRVVFAGELHWSAGAMELLLAASCADHPWPLTMVGRGRQTRAIERRAAALGVSHRLRVLPFTTDRAALARTFATAACVVSPGPPCRGRLVTLEAAATGAPIVAPEGALITQLAPELTHAFPAGDLIGLGNAIRDALTAPANPELGARLASTHSWERAFARELQVLTALLDRS